MNTYQVEIKPTSNTSIIKFETNRFLVRGEGLEFSNIDEAADSPIAQQLFYLPFVKKVYIAQNFIAIEKYDIVPWEEVQEETADQISEFLNQGGKVTKCKEAGPKKIPVTVYAESTPNPAAMKFATNRKLVIKTSEFKNIDEAKNAPLAKALFHFPFVKEVFFDENFISINKFDIAEWPDITMELREFIRNYLEEGKTVIDEEAMPAFSKTEEENTLSTTPVENLDEISQEIVSILDEYVKPAVASDGGNIVFESYDPQTKKVKVILQGACSGCPSSTLTLKNGIENMLKEMMPEKISDVEALNG